MADAEVVVGRYFLAATGVGALSGAGLIDVGIVFA